MINQSIIINKNAPLKEALIKLNNNPNIHTLIIEDENKKIVGTLTDGDIRKGLIDGLKNNDEISKFMFTSFSFLKENYFDYKKLKSYKDNGIKIVPVLNNQGHLTNILDFNVYKTILPIDAVIMAGGKGERLMPLTQNTPKPMLKIGGKPIVEYNINLLKSYGVKNLFLSVKYLKNIIQNYFKDGADFNLNIKYVTENEPLGTIGAVKQIKNFKNDYILVMNSDLLTNINLEKMFDQLLNNNADLVVATTEYEVKIPYGVIETKDNTVKTLKEKPIYSFKTSAGIYIFKRELINLIPTNSFFNATDFLDKLIAENKKVLYYSIKGYWLDIGRHSDFEKAKHDVKSIKF